MGLERLFCYSRHFPLGNVQRVFGNVLKRSLPSSGSVCNRASAPGLFGGLFVHTGRQLTARRSLCTSTQLARDVTLFEHDRTRFFRLLSVFCGGQLIFWTYLAHFAFTGLRDTGGSGKKDKAKAPTITTGLAGMWSFEMNLGSNSWRYGFTLGCLAVGGGIVGLGLLFCRRSVNSVVLHRGGKMVTVCTQSPLGPGKGRKITAPLSEVACHAHRQESPSFIPLRVKGHKFYFLLDKEGTVNNARLFDITVGAYRPV
ncbi:transmembrane protein 223 [Mugil cephalus]|uniref:transmembrane protein 223 n=1 Tax=Mugil cephalus TaxID=48193 RepID=UPI001FB6B329|nr:transmembrane protein 223 [Mugil cephalus]